MIDKYLNDPLSLPDQNSSPKFDMVEMIGIEPTTCTLRTYRSPN